MAIQKKPDDKIRVVNPCAWMLTFSDLMTLMLTFFVLLFSMSTVDNKKIQGAFGTLTGAFGALGKTESAEMAPIPFQTLMAPVPEKLIRNLEDMLQRHVREAPVEIKIPPEHEAIPDPYRNQFKVERVDDGVEVLIAADLLFDRNGWKLMPQSVALLKEVGGEVAEWGVPVKVEAFVSPEDENRDKAWELSIYRASAVTDVLAGVTGVDPQLLSMMGYGRPAPKSLKNRSGSSLVRVKFFTNVRDADAERSGIDSDEVQ
jgi:chemotaxis protein MotB